MNKKEIAVKEELKMIIMVKETRHQYCLCLEAMMQSYSTICNF